MRHGEFLPREHIFTIMALPMPRQRLVTRDGTVWVVRKVMRDLVYPPTSSIELVLASEEAEPLSDSVLIYAKDWKLWCDANGVVASERP